MQVFEGSSPVRVCLDTSLPRTFEMEADSVVDALGWRESLGAAMNRYDTANKAMAAKHAGDVRVPSGGGGDGCSCSCHAGISVIVCLRAFEGPSCSVQRSCPSALLMQLESLESLIVMAERLHEIVVKK